MMNVTVRNLKAFEQLLMDLKKGGLKMQGVTLISIFILLFVIFQVHHNVYIKPGVKKAFILASMMIAFIVIGEQIAELVTGSTGTIGYVLAHFGNSISKMLSPLVPLGFNYYTEEGMFRSKKKTMIPILIYEGLCILNIKYPIIFGINPVDNSYFRGPLIPVVTIISAYSFLLFMYGKLREEYELEPYDVAYLTLVYLMMLFGTLVQMIFPTVQILWCCVSIATLMYYMFIQELYYKTDTVTGLKNRNVFNFRIHQLKKEKNVIMISFDLNDLKKINDNQGHAVGDHYLRATAKTIQKCFKGVGRLYRVGGDEFCLISVNVNKYILDKRLEVFKELKNCYSEYGDFKFSLAYGTAERTCGEKIEDCLKRADKKMYENKVKQKKSAYNSVGFAKCS